MRNSSSWWIFLTIMLLLDLYIFQVVKSLTQGAGDRLRMGIYIAYWAVSAASVLGLLFLPYLRSQMENSRLWASTLFAILIGLFLGKLVAAVFFLIDDVRRIIQWIVIKLSGAGRGEAVGTGNAISRWDFLSWTGILLGGGLFGTLLYGFSNKYDYHIRRVRLKYGNLPEAFRGLKVVQLSDIHSGSFNDRAAVERGVEMVLAQQPDLILFTGDLVNNMATEMEDYIEVFSKLNAPLGVFSTLGNHDYGDYHEWESAEAKVANLNRLKAIHAEMGWRLLMNEHVRLERGGQEIALLGVENWSAKARFPKYGDLAKAYAGSEQYPFKILMSHDPSHWDAEVLTKFQDIDLMLAGHTHGMQFGIEIPGLKWSPVQYVYRQWAGLYETAAQKLYVNRGYGFLGYPGRVGILPEITVLEFA